MVGVLSVNRVARLAALCLVAHVAGCGRQDTGSKEVGVTRAALLSAANCPAGYNIIQGTSIGQTLTGTAGNDCILGHGGNDVLNGMGGNDFLIGGAGTDTLYGHDGDDTLYGEDGGDTLNGSSGNDTLYGGLAADRIIGGDGNNVAYGEAGNDAIDGGFHEDRLYGGAGLDIIRGGYGRDRIFGDADADDLFGDSGDDIIDGGTGDDDIWGGFDHDVIQGGANNDNLRGEGGNDAIIDVSGVNTVDGGSGSDRCSGTSCELPQPTVTGCAQDSQCSAPQTCVAEIGVCLPCLSDFDGDGACDGADGCQTDPGKIAPGICGCGVADTDSDGDGTPDCNDACPSDPNKAAAIGCGCGVVDTGDSDSDGTLDCHDGCPADPNKFAPGGCGCGAPDIDSDADGVADCIDVCAGGDDTVDEDQDGIPDACGGLCAAGAVGPTVHQGDAFVYSSADIAALEGITCITGRLFISANDLIDLTGLEALEEVVGDLTISNNGSLSSLAGLDNIERVGNLWILGNPDLVHVDDLAALTSVTGFLAVEGNDSLLELEGLMSIESIGTWSHIAFNSLLPPCWTWLIAQHTGVECGYVFGGVRQETCVNNLGSESCGELPPDFVCEPGAMGPNVYRGDVLISGSDPGYDLSLVTGARCITGDLTIADAELAELVGLEHLKEIGGDLIVVSSDLVELELPALDWVAGKVRIEDNDGLVSLAGLAKLLTIGSVEPDALVIDDNQQLSQCWTWLLTHRTGVPCGLSSSGGPGIACDGNLGTASCGELPPDFVCEPGARGPGVFDGDAAIAGPNASSQLALIASASCITGHLSIHENALTELPGLVHLQAIGGSLTVYRTQLSDVDLPALRSVGGTLFVTENDNLVELTGLATLDSVGSGNPLNALVIGDNPQLPHCWTWLTENQTGLRCGEANGFPDFYSCDGNAGTGSCGELPPDFVCEPGAVGPYVYGGDVTIDGANASSELARVSGAQCITGDLRIVSTQLTNVDGLGSLQAIGGTLHVQYNSVLADLDGLANLQDLGSTAMPGSFLVNGNAQLPPCWVQLIEDQLSLECGNPTDSCTNNDGQGICPGEPPVLPPDYCFPGATGPGIYDGYVDFSDTPNVTAEELAGIHCITGGLWITNSTITNLDMFSSLVALGSELAIGSTNLVNLDGLAQLVWVGYGINIVSNPVLSDLNGLTNVRWLGATEPDFKGLVIRYNASLPACWESELEEQLSVECGNLWGGPWSVCENNEGAGVCE